MSENLVVGFIGNPNCGKTTLFNAFTGANLKVANWPGVTVEKVEGALRYHNNTYRLVDLPGTYSLTSYTMEEQVSRQYILSDEVDVIVDVADASSLERNLYLTLQLLELGKPVVLALNMMDIVEKRGMEIDLHRLPEMLGIPVIPVSARKRTGLEILMHAVSHHKDAVMPDKLVLGYFTFYSLNGFFYIRTVIYMNMPEDTPRLFMFTHIIFQMLFLMVLTVFQRVMPFSQVFENFRIHVSLFIEEVYSFIQIDNYMKQRIQSTIFLTGSRQHRHPEQLAQQMVI